MRIARLALCASVLVCFCVGGTWSLLLTRDRARIIWLTKGNDLRIRPTHCTAKTTLVTAYYDLGTSSKHPRAEYASWYKTFFLLADSMVIFTDEKSAQELVKLRRQSRGCSLFVVQNLRHTFAGTEFNWTGEQEKDPERHIHKSSELYVIWNKKVAWLFSVSRENPFHSSYFFWADSGQFRGSTFQTEKLHSGVTWISHAHLVPRGRIAILSITQFTVAELESTDKNVTIIHSTDDRLAAGNFGGDGAAVANFYSVYYKILSSYFNRGAFAGKEQSILSSTCLAVPNLCYIVDSRKLVAQHVADNPWFALQPVLHGIVQHVPIYDPFTGI